MFSQWEHIPDAKDERHGIEEAWLNHVPALHLGLIVTKTTEGYTFALRDARTKKYLNTGSMPDMGFAIENVLQAAQMFAAEYIGEYAKEQALAQKVEIKE